MPTLCLILASGFWLLTGATVATTLADIELTQHCIQRELCREGNPLMSGKRKVVYPVSLGIAAAMSYAGYKMKQRGNENWWVPQAALVAGHGAGISFGLRFVW